MDPEDPDWLRKAVQRQQSARRKWRVVLNVAITVVTIVYGLVLLPVAVTPRCDFGSWNSVSLACWQSSWIAFKERVNQIWMQSSH